MLRLPLRRHPAGDPRFGIDGDPGSEILTGLIAEIMSSGTVAPRVEGVGPGWATRVDLPRVPRAGVAAEVVDSVLVMEGTRVAAFVVEAGSTPGSPEARTGVIASPEYRNDEETLWRLVRVDFTLHDGRGLPSGQVREETITEGSMPPELYPWLARKRPPPSFELVAVDGTVEATFVRQFDGPEADWPDIALDAAGPDAALLPSGSIRVVLACADTIEVWDAGPGLPCSEDDAVRLLARERGALMAASASSISAHTRAWARPPAGIEGPLARAVLLDVEMEKGRASILQLVTPSGFAAWVGRSVSKDEKAVAWIGRAPDAEGLRLVVMGA